MSGTRGFQKAQMKAELHFLFIYLSNRWTRLHHKYRRARLQIVVVIVVVVDVLMVLLLLVREIILLDIYRRIFAVRRRLSFRAIERRRIFRALDGVEHVLGFLLLRRGRSRS